MYYEAFNEDDETKQKNDCEIGGTAEEVLQMDKMNILNQPLSGQTASRKTYGHAALLFPAAKGTAEKLKHCECRKPLIHHLKLNIN